MQSYENTTQTIQIDRVSTDIHHSIDNIDPTFHTFLVMFTLLNGIKNLVQYIKKLQKQSKGNYPNFNLYIKIVGIIYAIIKALGELLDERLIDRDDESE